MSFLHVLGQVGKAALGIAGPVATVLPPPIGVLVTAASAVAKAELDHQQPGSGQVKLAQATAATLPVAAASPLPPDGKIAQVGKLLESLVGVANALADLFPAS